MYFSLITPTPGMERQAAQQWIEQTDAYQEHQWLWHFFPGEPEAKRDFLFRRRDQDGVPRFYIVSQRPPQGVGPAWQVQSRDYAPQLQAGQWLEFELRANPVVTHSRTGKSQRHDVIIEAKKVLLAARGLKKWDDWKMERLDQDGHPDPRPELYQLALEHGGHWLEKRGPSHGFALALDSLAVDGYQQQRGQARGIQFSSVDFKGLLQVTNPETFVTKALTQGLGRAKAFGCGLMLVRRV